MNQQLFLENNVPQRKPCSHDILDAHPSGFADDLFMNAIFWMQHDQPGGCCAQNGVIALERGGLAVLVPCGPENDLRNPLTVGPQAGDFLHPVAAAMQQNQRFPTRGQRGPCFFQYGNHFAVIAVFTARKRNPGAGRNQVCGFFQFLRVDEIPAVHKASGQHTLPGAAAALGQPDAAGVGGNPPLSAP
jgi:hypothetical protein